jgi:hypothetical protein
MAFGVLTTDTVQQAMARGEKDVRIRVTRRPKLIEMIELVKLLKRRRD